MSTSFNSLLRRARRFGSPLFDVAVRRCARRGLRLTATLSPTTQSKLEIIMTKMLPAAVVLTAALTLATSVHAESRKLVAVQTTITYRTGELTSVDGARTLLGRVDQAALRLCRPAMRSLADRPIPGSEVAACRSRAVAKAVAELDAPMVSAAYAQTMSAQLAAN